MSESENPIAEDVSVGPSRHSRAPLAVALLIGWAIIGFGINAALHDARDAHPTALLLHVIAFDLGHDIVVAPIAFLVFWLVGRFAPVSVRGPIRAALAATALFTVFSIPLVKRWGQRPTNSSTLPLPYGRNLLIIIAIIWSLAAATSLWRIRARRSASPND